MEYGSIDRVRGEGLDFKAKESINLHQLILF